MGNDKNNIQQTKQNEMRKLRKTRSICPTYNITTDKLIECLKIKIKMKSKKYPVDYDWFKDFIENATSCSDPLSISKNYTSNTQSLITMINTLYLLLKIKLIKNRFTRIQNRLVL